jgi:myo-inositol-1(or 4)-monophosphatase
MIDLEVTSPISTLFMDLNKYLKFTLALSRTAGKIASEYYGKNIRINFKGEGKNNLVTEVDRKVEDYLVKTIHKTFPDHCVLSEESGDCGIKPSSHRWIIDPIDGTTNYAHGYDFFAVSIGLEINGKMMVGVVNAPVLKKLFHAAKDKGSFLNGKPIKVSRTRNLDTALLATGFTYKNRGLNLPNFEYFLYNTQGIRRCGAATLDFCYLAAGRLDGYWELGLRPWDMAAGSLIVEEAGGKVTTLDGKPLNLLGKSSLATNGLLHPAMLKFFKDQPILHELIRETP